MKPRVVMVADYPGRAFSLVGHALKRALAPRFDIRVVHRATEPVTLSDDALDLLYVFWWGDESYIDWGIDPSKIIKEVASHRWALEEKFGLLTPAQFVETYLGDARIVTTPSRRLFRAVAPIRDDVYHCPNGVNTAQFFFRPRRGRLRIGWVGNPNDESKGLYGILAPAARGFSFTATERQVSHDRVASLLRQVDVIAIGSTAEGQPLPLIEGMACGCFPVTTDVGVAGELVRSGVNGLVVDRSVGAFADAFTWCADHVGEVRRAGALNATLVEAERPWPVMAERFAALFDYALGRGEQPPPEPAGPASAARCALDAGAIPVRIALVTPALVTEDPEHPIARYFARLAGALVALGHRVEVFGLAGISDTLEIQGVVIHRVRRPDPKAHVGGELRTWARRVAPAAVVRVRDVADATALASVVRGRSRHARFDIACSARRTVAALVGRVATRGVWLSPAERIAAPSVSGPAAARWLLRHLEP